jgi:hypothetical protein
MPDGVATLVQPKRKSRLTAVLPETVEPKKPKALIFGPPGVGKTWFSIDFPSVYYFDTEGGADLNHYRDKLRKAGGAYFGPDQGSLDFEAVIGQVQALATEKHAYRTMVFDSATKLFNNAISEEGERLGDKDVFGASKKPAVRQMARLVRWVSRADMNAIFICHQKDEWGIVNGKREAIGWTFDCYEKLAYDLHLVLRIDRIGSGETARRFAHIGKSRLLGFPEGGRFELSYDEFASRYGRDILENEVKQIILANEEQITEVKRLLEVVKLPDGTVEKWFTKAGVDAWEEMDAAIIAKCIASLKERVV